MKKLLILPLLGVLLSCNSGPKPKTMSKAEFDSAMNETHIKVDISPDFGGAHDKYQAYLVDTNGDIKVVDSIFSWGDTTRHLKKKKHEVKAVCDAFVIAHSYPDTSSYPDSWEPVYPPYHHLEDTLPDTDNRYAIGQSIVGTSVVGKPFPCPLDTVRGIMMWNRPDDYGNDGNMWDNGYYVGLCGPSMSMPVDSVVFFAGVMSRTYSMAKCPTCDFHIYNEEYIQSGKFYDSQWHQIPTKSVFAFIILRH